MNEREFEIITRAAQLANETMQVLRERVASNERYGDNPPTRRDVRETTNGLTKGDLIAYVLMSEFDV